MDAQLTVESVRERFKILAAKFPVSLPDHARVGIGSLTAGDVRAFVAGGDADTIGDAADCIPQHAYSWTFGASGLTYGDFLDARKAAGL